MDKGWEIERRWLVADYDAAALVGPRMRIVQGYFDDVVGASKRIRITDDREAVMTIKRGEGKIRREEETALDIEEARLQLARTSSVIHKTRVKQDGWDIDILDNPPFGLTGGQPLIVAEFEMKSADEKVTTPSWWRDSIEVTDLICTELLADFISFGIPKVDTLVDDLDMVSELPDKTRVILLCGGTVAQRQSLTTKLLELKPEKFIDASRVGNRIYPNDPTLFQAFLLNSLQRRKKMEQEALFVLSGQTYTDCWKGLIQANPFGMDGDNVLTIVLDNAQVESLVDREWVNSDAFVRHSELEGKLLLDYWAAAHDVYYLGQMATSEMQDWAVVTVVKAYFSRV
ncbi:MAG: hypothetical protein RDU25_03840 [Patescibacteria group bacterium]|nr:hypothetical protein [Patescibacteria group bacterium]